MCEQIVKRLGLPFFTETQNTMPYSQTHCKESSIIRTDPFTRSIRFLESARRFCCSWPGTKNWIIGRINRADRHKKPRVEIAGIWVADRQALLNSSRVFLCPYESIYSCSFRGRCMSCTLCAILLALENRLSSIHSVANKWMTPQTIVFGSGQHILCMYHMCVCKMSNE